MSQRLKQNEKKVFLVFQFQNHNQKILMMIIILESALQKICYETELLSCLEYQERKILEEPTFIYSYFDQFLCFQNPELLRNKRKIQRKVFFVDQIIFEKSSRIQIFSFNHSIELRTFFSSLKISEFLNFRDDYKIIIKYNTMNKSWILTFLLLAIASSAATVPYHERRLYYNDQDYCCLGGIQHDNVNLVITFNDRPKITQKISGHTICNPYTIFDVDRITASDSMYYSKCFYEQYEYCDTIKFQQKLITHRIGLKVTSLVQKSTVSNPAKIDQKEYHCEIQGDGNVEHFGPIGNIPAPTIYMTCNHTNSNLPIQSLS